MKTFFTSYPDLQKRLKNELGNKYDEKLLNDLIEMGLITSVFKDNAVYFFENDVIVSKNIIEENYNISAEIDAFFNYKCDLFFDIVKLGKGTYIRTIKGEKKQKMPTYMKQISALSLAKYEPASECILFDLPGGVLISNNQYVIRYYEGIENRQNILSNVKVNDFANTSTYMGIKRSITDFIIEAIIPHSEAQMVFLDIMCGSGSVSNAFSQFGRTYASDAQHFCTLLAKVQGKGLNNKHASELLDKLYPLYIQNVEALNNLLKEYVHCEEEIFHMDAADVDCVFKLYEEFISAMKLYSSTEAVPTEISDLVNERKHNHKKFPYCLFSTYYSNVYFGTQQCIQIDSLRYAIDQIHEQNDRDWLLGVLVITASVVATNYGGHFAQPKKVDKNNITIILEKRKQSVWLEFSKRLLEIASESEKKAKYITIVPGPWRNAIKWLEKQKEKEVLVYLDAPYKREDYSRYYHVLETLTLYDYPSSEYKGRNRSLQNGERFRSEFSTRNIEKIEKQLILIITNVLTLNGICAWSYSNNGNADIMKVIDCVKNNMSCDVYLYATEHRHNGQGKRKNSEKDIIEYCIVFKK